MGNERLQKRLGSKVGVILLLTFFTFSCEKDYEILSDSEISTLIIEDTLQVTQEALAYLVKKSKDDFSNRLLIKKKHNYLFNSNCFLENDSLIHAYYSAFIIDRQGEFRKNGLWVHTTFTREGTFPFHHKVRCFGVDSIPNGWDGNRPTKEGIYFFNNGTLEQLSVEQSEEAFEDEELTGFYFFPNKGRLFDKIKLKELK